MTLKRLKCCGGIIITMATVASFTTILLAMLLLTTTLPRRLGFYQFVTMINPRYIGLTPSFLDGEESWKYSWKDFYAEETQTFLQGQTAIVTGGNSGIGLALAMALASSGVHVTITCRSVTKCDKAKQDIEAKVGGGSMQYDDNKTNKTNNNNTNRVTGSVQTMVMDTSSLASVRSFCEEYMATLLPQDRRIDMLFFNAGTNHVNMEYARTDPNCYPKTEQDGIEYHFQVNYLSHHLMYRLFEPYLSDNARIVQTSSTGSFSTYKYKVATNLETLHGCSEPYLSLYGQDKLSQDNNNVWWLFDNLSYGQSKLAQIVWCKALTRRQQLQNNYDDNNSNNNTRTTTHQHPRNVAANAFHPGLVSTPIFNKLGIGKWQVYWMSKWILPYIWQSHDGAMTGLYLATTPNNNPHIRGKYFHPQAIEVVHALAEDEDLQDKLWDFSNALVREYLAPIGALKRYGVTDELPFHEDGNMTQETRINSLKSSSAVAGTME